MKTLFPPVVQARVLPSLQNSYVLFHSPVPTTVSGFVLAKGCDHLLHSSRSVSHGGVGSFRNGAVKDPGASYDNRYDSPLIRGIDEPRPWDLEGIICSHTASTDVLLDIGCGTAMKIPPLAASARWVVGLEPNPLMIAKSLENLTKSNVTNATIIQGIAEDMPFSDNTFDVVTCMLAAHRTDELHRVLKPGGYAVLEKLGDRDKWALASKFKGDELGSRARFGNMQPGERAAKFRHEFEGLFSEVQVRNEFWTTYYTVEGLKLLHELTPTVRGYAPHEDDKVIEEYASESVTKKGVPLAQNRILIIAKK